MDAIPKLLIIVEISSGESASRIMLFNIEINSGCSPADGILAVPTKYRFLVGTGLIPPVAHVKPQNSRRLQRDIQNALGNFAQFLNM
jgi:hypothetical protein